MPLFSVLIPSYNRPELIGETVDSILKNDFDDFEIIISDDKSPRQEQIALVLQPFLCDPRVRLHLQPGNLREAGNRDFLFQASGGQWLIVLGDDDRLYPHALSTLATAIRMYPGADIYAFGYTIIDEYGRTHYSRQAPKPLRVSIQDQRLAREIIVSDCFPFWLYHPATFCSKREVHQKIKSSQDVGIGDDFMFMIDFINSGGVMQIVPDTLMFYRKAASGTIHLQLNLSSGELPQLIARTKIMKQLSLRTDFHMEIAEFVKSQECRERLLYDSILWSRLDIEILSKKLELSPDETSELILFAKRRPRIFYRKWLYLRRAMFFLSLFGLAGFQEMGKVVLSRILSPRKLLLAKSDYPNKLFSLL